MKTPIFIGAGTAIVTPFKGNKIDYDKMAELIEQQVSAGISAIIVCGTTGENATLPHYQHKELVDFCTKQIAGRTKVIAGVGSNNTMTSIELGQSAQKSGVDGILMVTPYYNKTSQRGLVQHFTTVADKIDVPMILYNVPSRTGIGIQPETYKILSTHPNINGAKEASGNLAQFSKTRALCGDDLNIWSGNDDNVIGFMSMGAKGVISVVSNILPQVMTDLCNFCLNNKFKEATDLYIKYHDVFSKLFIEVNPIPVKTAMNLMGMDVGELRLPLYEMAPENLEKLKKALTDVGIIKLN